MSDAWAQAVAEADAELAGSEETVAAEPTTTVVEDNQGATAEDSQEVVEEPEATTDVATEEAPPAKWWEEHLDDEIEVAGSKIPVRELDKYVLRQSDYTKKTQELAQERHLVEWAKKVQGALRADPVDALKQMAQELGLLDDAQEDFRPDEIDPALVGVQQLREEVKELKNEQLMLAIQREIHATRTAHADFDEEGVLGLVAELGSQGVPISIEDGYFLWKGRTATEKEAIAARAKAKADAEAARQTAARGQSTSVNSGHSPAANTQEERDYTKMSLRDIFNETADELGATFD